MGKIKVYKYDDFSNYKKKTAKHVIEYDGKDEITLSYADVVRYFWFLNRNKNNIQNIASKLSRALSVISSIKIERDKCTISDIFKNGNVDEKKRYSEDIGILSAKAISEKVHSIRHIYLLNEKSIDVEPKTGKKPDFWGVDKNNQSFLFEAKGTYDRKVDNGTVEGGIDQLDNVSKVTCKENSYTSFTKYVSTGSFCNEELFICEIDPPTYESRIEETKLNTLSDMHIKRYYDSIAKWFSKGDIECTEYSFGQDEYICLEVYDGIFIGIRKDINKLIEEGDFLTSESISVESELDGILENQESITCTENGNEISIGLDGTLCIIRDIEAFKGRIDEIRAEIHFMQGSEKENIETKD